MSAELAPDLLVWLWTTHRASQTADRSNDEGEVMPISTSDQAAALQALIADWRARKEPEGWSNESAEICADELEAVISSENSGWQPIETAPKDGTDVLLWGRDYEHEHEPRAWVGRWSTSAWYGPSWVGYEHRADTEYVKPTHWMPLPDAPVT